MPRYPRRLSLNLGLATSLRHSIWPKCAGYPSMWMYSSLAMLLCRAKESSSLKEVWGRQRGEGCLHRKCGG